MRRLLLVALTVAVVTPAAAQRVVGRNDDTFSLTERIGSGDWVRIASPNGTIRVTRGRGSSIEIRAEKDVRRGSIEDVGFVVRRSRDGVTVCAVYEDEDECTEDGSYRSRRRNGSRDRNRQIRVNFTVTIPDDARIRAGSGNGDIAIDGGSTVVAATGNGRVDITGAGGSVEVSSGNGRVTVDGARGPVEVSTGNGDIRVTTTNGPVNATSGNGAIDVAMDRLEGSPDMTFTTGNGRIHLQVPAGFGAELTSSTGNGRVDLDFPIRMQGRIRRSHVRGTIGDGGGRLVMTTGNGNVEIERR